MVTDSQLIDRLREILSTADLDTTTLSIVRRRLEEEFCIDLSDRKAFVKEHVDAYLRAQFVNVEEAEDGMNNEAEEEGSEEEEDDEENAEGHEEEEDESGAAASGSKSSSKKSLLCEGDEVEDSQLIDRLRVILSTADLDTMTLSILRSRLEEEFCIDLSDRKAFVKEHVDAYLRARFVNVEEAEDVMNNEAEEEGNEEEEEEEEEEDDEENAEGQEEEEDESQEEEEDESGAAASGSKSSSKKRSRKIKEVKERGGGFTKVCSLSPELEKFTGESELPRTEVVKKIWKYIRENSLQNPSNRRQILCDGALRNIFNVDVIDMFQMNKVLARHIWPLESDSEASVSSATKVKQQNQGKGEDEEDKAERKEKRPKGSAFLAPVKLSEPLVKFIGTGENELPRSDVVKRIWDYIKLNNLQDPSDRRQILCDEKLKELFDVETFHGFTVSKLLKPHLTKIE